MNKQIDQLITNEIQGRFSIINTKTRETVATDQSFATAKAYCFRNKGHIFMQVA